MLQKKSGTYLSKLEKIIFVQLMTLEYKLIFQLAFQEFILLVGWMQTIIQKILNYLKKQELHQKKKRTCHYTTVIALKSKDYEETFEYTLPGYVSKNTRGNNGFGFDEIFELESGLTLAEITTEEKLKISPRKKASDLVSEFVERHNI